MRKSLSRNSQHDVRGQHVAVLSGLDGRLNGAGALENVENGASRADIQPQVKAQVALGVQIHAQDFGAPLVKPADQGGGGGRLADPAFLVCNGDDLRQGIFPPSHKNLEKTIKFTILQVDKK